MSKSWLAALLALCCVPAAGADWRLIWSDEFDKDGAPNAAKWNYDEGFFFNNEAQYYTRGRPENVRIENGVLIIEARKERFANQFYREGSKAGRERLQFADYTSGRLTTMGKQSWRYGRIEVRAKLPAGRGTWPAIWMLGDDRSRVGWPKCGEIDIMEHVGFDPGVVHSNIHTQSYNHVKKTNKGNKKVVEDVTGTFHIYSVEWTEAKMDFFIDGKPHFSFANEKTGVDAWPFDQPFYLILNVAIGGSWGGQKGIDDAIFPQRMEVAYVRVYQQ